MVKHFKSKELKIDRTVKNPVELKKQLADERKRIGKDYDYKNAVFAFIREKYSAEQLEKVAGGRKNLKPVDKLIYGMNKESMSVANMEQQYLQYVRQGRDVSDYLEMLDNFLVSLVIEVESYVFGEEKNYYKEDVNYERS